jgi:hypothetical protein
MDKKSTKKEEQEQWKELYEYVKTYILQYDESMKLPKNLVLRLRGLRQGKFMANKNTRILGDYTFKVILTTFKLNKFEIIQAMSNKNKFKDESHMINYLMCIVENKINDTYLRIKKVEESQEKGQEIEVDITNNKAEYIHKTKEVKNSRLKDLL